MLKWLLTLVVAIFVFGMLAPHLARFIRFGQLPGDLVFHWRGRRYALPFTSTVLGSLALWLLTRLL